MFGYGFKILVIANQQSLRKLNLNSPGLSSLSSGVDNSESGVNLAPLLPYNTYRLTSKFVGVHYKITKNLSNNNT